MPRPDEQAYLAERARQERALADCCTDNAAASAHRRMAEEYERRARSLAQSGPLMEMPL